MNQIKAHTFVATHINYQAPRPETGLLFFKYKVYGVPGVLKGPVYNNTRFTDQLS